MFSRRTPAHMGENPIARALARRGGKFVDLTLSNPTQAGLAYPGEKILSALAKPEALLYEPDPRGGKEAREALCRHLCAKGIPARSDRMFLTASTSEAYSFLFKLLCDPGDEVLVPEPSYPLLEHLLGLEAARRVPYRLRFDGAAWRVDFHSLEAALSPRTRALCVISPNNPTGNYLQRGERERLAALARDRAVALIADEVFFDYPLGPLPAGASSLAGESGALCFALGGISKMLGLPQLKLGWILAGGPPGVLDEALDRLELVADTFLSAGAPVQAGLSDLLALEGEIQGAIRARTAKNLAALREACAGSPLGPLPVEGGWYAMLELPAHIEEERFVLDLLEKDGVLVQPGFFFDSPKGAYAVVSLLPPEPAFQAGVQALLARARA